VNVLGRVKSLVHGALAHLDLELTRKSRSPHRDRYERLIQETESLFVQLLYRDLPRRPGREKMLADLIGTNISEALYVLAFLHRSLAVSGDICEFGVAQGATSALLAWEIAPIERHLWLFDSFEGLPAPSEKDVLIDDIFTLGSMARYEGQMANPESLVRARLRAIDFPPGRTHIVRGFIEDSVRHGELPSSVAFAYVDFDFYEPIRVALRFLDERLTPGGSVIVDDYGWFSAGAQSAVDEFLAERGADYEIVRPLDGSGYFIVLTRKPSSGSTR